MKSPWKFLAQLIPQRRSAETSESSIGQNSDIERSRSEAEQLSSLPLNATEHPHGSEHEESQPTEVAPGSTPDQFEPEMDAAREEAMPDEVEELHALARRQRVRPTAQPQALRVESEPNEKSGRTPTTKKPERAQRIRSDTIGPRVARARDKTDQARSSREAFFEEVAGLDEDINQLRKQLARKLHLQNVQLKKMLERFDVS